MFNETGFVLSNELQDNLLNNRIPLPWTIQRTLAVVVTSILVSVGLIGNFISCCVIKLYLLKSSGTYVLFLFLSVSDSLVIVIMTTEAVLNSFYGGVNYLSGAGGVACKFFRFLWHFCFQLSAWMIVALTVERYTTLRYYHIIRDKRAIVRRAWIFSAIVILFVIVLNAHFFYTTGMVQGKNLTTQAPICGYVTVNPERTQIITNAIHMIFYGVIPYGMTVGFNALLIQRLRQCRHSGQIRTTAMLLVVTSAFIVLTLPYMVNVVVLKQMSKTLFEAKDVYAMNISDDIVRYMLFLNNSLNFGFYMTGRQFRHATKCMFRCIPYSTRRRSSQFASHTSNTKDVNLY